MQDPAKPNPHSYAGLDGVAATSRTNAWAIENTKVVRWNGTAWRIQPSPTNPGVDDLHGVSATSPTNAWAVGEHVPGSFNFTLVEHWNGNG